MSGFISDLRYSLRHLWRTPGFTAAVTLTLALAMGVNGALFSLASGVLSGGMNIPNLDRLVAITRVSQQSGNVWASLPQEEFRTIVSARLPMFEAFVIHDSLVAPASANGLNDIVSGELVSDNYFQALGVVPRIGRLLEPGDDRRATEPAAVISERLWRTWFSSMDTIVGQEMRLNGVPVRIVGVAPGTFKGSWVPGILSADVWVPVSAARDVLPVETFATRRSHRVLAVLSAGATLAQADAAVRTIGEGIQIDGPGRVLAVLPARAGMVPDEFDRYGGYIAGTVLALAGLVFLIGCANLVNLLLARNISRASELALRMAVGATPRQVMRLVVIETLALSLAAAAFGLWLAHTATKLMLAVPLPALDGLRVTFDPTPDAKVFFYAAGLAVVAALGLGLTPCRQASRVAPSRLVAAHGFGLTDYGRRVRSRLVGAQVAMSLMLMILAALSVQSAINAARVDPGYPVEDAVIATMDLSRYTPETQRTGAVQERLLSAVGTLPGVTHAALATAVPVATPAQLTRAYGTDPGSTSSAAAVSLVSADFVQTLGLKILSGRGFNPDDGAGTARIALVSARLAARLWPGEDPLGKVLLTDARAGALVVVGVTSDTAWSERDPRAAAWLYLPLDPHAAGKLSLLIRTPDNVQMRADLQTRLGAVDPDVPIYDIRTLADAVGLRLAPVRLMAGVLAVLSSMGFSIALLGVYSVMAFFVRLRTREFGIHIALGAQPRDVRMMIVRQGLRSITPGVVIGLVMALGVAGTIRHFLFGIAPFHPATYLLVTAVTVFAGLVASAVPALRATRGNPASTLRQVG
jgi:predicted permease